MSTLCITPNVALDHIFVVPRFAVGSSTRAETVYTSIGGKGLNVARALASLGKSNHSAGLIGGANGDLAARSAEQEGLTATWTRIAGETRNCLIILARGTPPTVISEPGPMISASEWAAFETVVGQLAHGRTAVCIGGSLPPGCPPRAIARLMAVATGEKRSVPVWIDGSEAVAAEAVAGKVFGLKLNAAGAEALAGRRVATVTDALNAAHMLIERGVTRVAITLAAHGAILASGDRAYYARPPTITEHNAAGSGESFLAGLVAAFGDGSKEEDALRLATACGTANARTAWAGRFTATDVMRVADEIAVHPVSLV